MNRLLEGSLKAESEQKKNKPFTSGNKYDILSKYIPEEDSYDNNA